MYGVRHGVADLRIRHALDVSGDKPDFARTKLRDRGGMRGKHAHFRDFVIATRRHEAHFLALTNHTIDNADHDHRAAITVVPTIEYQRARRPTGLAFRCGYTRDDGLENVLD